MTAGVELQGQSRNVQSEIKRVSRHTMVYGVGVVLGKLASFLMLPIYTRYLTTTDYGVLELLAMTIDVIAMIAGAGLAGGLFKFYAEFDDREDKRQTVSTMALGTLGLALVASVLGFVFAEQINDLVFPQGGNPLYFRIFFLIYFFQAAGGPAMLLLRIQDRSVAFIGVNLAKLVLSLTLNIYLIVVRGMGVEGAMYANLIVSGLAAAGLMAYTVRQVGLTFSAEKFRRMARFGTPLIVVSLSSFVMTFSDRYFLNYAAGTSDVGIYALAYRFSFVLSTLAVLPFQQVWEPRRFDIAKQPNAGLIYHRMFFYYSLMLLGGATLMVAFIRDFLAIMAAPEFLPAYHVVPLLLVVTIIQQWTTYCNLGLYLRDRTNLLAWASVTSVAVVLLLNTLLIPRYGIMGAAWATVGAYTVRFVMIYALAQRAYFVRYPWPRVAALTGIFLAVWLARWLVTPSSIATSIAFSCGLLAVAGGAVYFQLLSGSERAVITGLVARLRPARALGSP